MHKVVWSIVLRTRCLAVASAVVATFASLQVPLMYQTLSEWGERDSSHDWTYYKRFCAVCFGLMFLNSVKPLFDTFAAAVLCHSLAADVDRALVSLGMPFFWRGREAAEPEIRKVLTMDPTTFLGLAQLPVAILQGCVVVGAVASQCRAPSLWLLMGACLVVHRRTMRLSDWKATQLMPAVLDARSAGLARMVEQTEHVVGVRALGREEGFERNMHPTIMALGYFTYLSLSSEALSALLTHTTGAVFNSIVFVLVLRLKTTGAGSTELFTFLTLAQTLNDHVKGTLGLYKPFQSLMERYRSVESLTRPALEEPQGGAAPPPGWPAGAGGALRLEAVSFAYGPGVALALRDVTLEVAAGENLGIIGKTGSGKSTLASLLLRLGPLAAAAGGHGSGRVLLDGVDLAALRVRDLRPKFAVVPQEAAILQGSLKFNVGEEFSDAEVLTALEWCGLDARKLTGRDSLQEALASEVAPGSLSAGQQQLLMAARALARRPAVLILDECTASLDHTSADRLLRVIRDHARGATTLAIAHRLRFVRDCDRVLTLAHGRVVGLDTPARLLEDPTSYFAVNLRLEQQEDGE